MGKAPAFQFYPGDWMKDPALRSVSIAARGLWIDLLCLMFECPERGVLARADGSPWTEHHISRATGVGIKQVRSLLRELVESDVCQINHRGAPSSRRLQRDQLIRDSSRLRQAHYKQKQRLSSKSNAPVTPPVTQRSHGSSSSTSISTSYEVLKKENIKEKDQPKTDQEAPSQLPAAQKPLAPGCQYLRLTESEMGLVAKWFEREGYPAALIPHCVEEVDLWLAGTSRAAKAARKHHTHRTLYASWVLEKAAKKLEIRQKSALHGGRHGLLATGSIHEKRQANLDKLIADAEAEEAGDDWRLGIENMQKTGVK